MSYTTSDKSGLFAPSTAQEVLKGFFLLQLSHTHVKEAIKDFPVHTTLLSAEVLLGTERKDEIRLKYFLVACIINKQFTSKGTKLQRTNKTYANTTPTEI